MDKKNEPEEVVAALRDRGWGVPLTSENKSLMDEAESRWLLTRAAHVVEMGPEQVSVPLKDLIQVNRDDD